MLHPSYTELMTKINEEAGTALVESRYSIVMGTAKRARQMVDKGYYTLLDHSRKPLSIAVDELNDGDIRILSPEEDAEYQARYAERRAAQAALRAEEEARRRAEEEALRASELKAMEEEEEEDFDEEDEEIGADEDLSQYLEIKDFEEESAEEG
ncbi:MAG: DNA-directed RNA polymerase subunit omega [Lachnospiraceae bacterium]|nr:DNA-directed RNA polymerase subunit omega [Lachnospiraceae bacterium]